MRGLLGSERLPMLLAATVVSAEESEDPYLWLEDIDGEKSLDWVHLENKLTAEKLAAKPIFEQLHAQAKAALNAKRAHQGLDEIDAFEFLKTIRCDKLQGFLISEAVLPHIVRRAYSSVAGRKDEVA